MTLKCTPLICCGGDFLLSVQDSGAACWSLVFCKCCLWLHLVRVRHLCAICPLTFSLALAAPVILLKAGAETQGGPRHSG